MFIVKIRLARRWRWCVLSLGSLSLLITCAVYQSSKTTRSSFKVPPYKDQFEERMSIVNRTEDTGRLSNVSLSEDRENWIVVTTISQPSSDIAKLANIPNWQLLVVGDLKTPKEWNFPGCIFLSVEQQMTLDYDVVKQLPYNSYTRKNIGYLYAIQHGAKFIYDTDDDNHPINGLSDFHLSDTMTGLIYDHVQDDVVNPYAHFGQPSIWPRGYPLERVQSSVRWPYKVGTFRTPAIQQGLVNGDPDVDAIFRLTRKKPHQEFTFDPQAPPVTLPRGVFAPFNSQNTLIAYDAFWSLFLPASVAFRVTDIWRGFWAQRLLWLVGQHLAFFPPNAFQKRNAHDYLKDFRDEQQFYMQTSELLRYLTRWHCHDGPFFSCVSRLSHSMADAGFWNESDAFLIDSWLSDLQKAGYREPRLEDGTANISKDGGLRRMYFFPTIQGTLLPSYRSAVFDLQELCAPFTNGSVQDIVSTSTSSPARGILGNMLLIIVFHNPFYTNIGILDTLYRDHFPNIVYCGQTDSYKKLMEEVRKGPVPLRQPYISFINITAEKGYFGYECVIRAIEMNQRHIDGYVVIGDDVLLNFWNIPSMNLNKSQLDSDSRLPLDRRANPRDAKWSWWETAIGKTALDATYDELAAIAEGAAAGNDAPALDSVQRFVRNTANLTLISSCLSDIYYVSASDAKMFADVARIFLKHRVFLEIAVPTIIMALHPPPYQGEIYGTNIWDNDKRQGMMRLFNASSQYLHPVKFSNLAKDTELRETFCNRYWYSWLENW